MVREEGKKSGKGTKLFIFANYNVRTIALDDEDRKGGNRKRIVSG